MYTIENDKYKVTINSLGAELSGIINKQNGKEYMWQGDPLVWSGRSPVLFPIIGRLVNDEYIYDGVTYHLKKHGFVREAEFSVIEHTKDSLILSFCANEQTRAVYPFEFALEIVHKLCDDKLLVSYRVKNNDTKTMPFSIGAHPAFICDMGDTVKFEVPEKLNVYRHDDESILSDDICYPFLDNEDTVVITKDIFVEDAVILTDIKSTSLTLNTASGRNVKISFGHVPALGIWAKPGAPFVCLEPWHGVDDFRQRHGDITKKRKNNMLLSGEEFVFDFSIICD